jgi:predicted chitinase
MTAEERSAPDRRRHACEGSFLPRIGLGSLTMAFFACSGAIGTTDYDLYGGNPTPVEDGGRAGPTGGSRSSTLTGGAAGAGANTGAGGSLNNAGAGGGSGASGSSGGRGGSSGTSGSTGTGGTSKDGGAGSGGASGSGGSSGAGGSSGGTSGFSEIVSESLFNQMFPKRNAFYTYQGLVQATKLYSSFANEGSLDTRKREAAAFLANMARETGELVYIEQIAKGPYCAPSAMYPCAPGQEYYGRGPIQISWNFNYGACGDALGLDLLHDPGLVARDAKVAWETGLWFWTTSSPSGETCHSAMTKSLGFGVTIQIINGGVECGGRAPDAVQDRVNHYQTYCALLGVDPGGTLYC